MYISFLYNQAHITYWGILSSKLRAHSWLIYFSFIEHMLDENALQIGVSRGNSDVSVIFKKARGIIISPV
jgi:hypothetical protein